MKQDIRIGGKAFVVDDPHGSLERVQAHEQVSDHPENAHVEATLRETRERRARERLGYDAMPNNNDFVGTIRGRSLLLERFYQGHVSRGWLVFAWLLFGPLALLVFLAFGNMALQNIFSAVSLGQVINGCVGLICAEAFPIAWFFVMIRATLASMARRRD